ncbi:MAG: transcription elongation factor GreA [Calditrichaeota bacterium]|nr:transcription elongation factor GreA [Calditrichota bacterium]
METVYLTRNGLEKMRRELENLVKVVRPDATAQLAAARALGDLSENAEYHAAREKLASVDRMIGDLQRSMLRVQIIEREQLDLSEVRILSRVRLLNLNNNSRMDYILVDPTQANPSKKMISVKSPIGQGLLGKGVGDEVDIDVPSGKLRLRIEAIEPAEGV